MKIRNSVLNMLRFFWTSERRVKTLNRQLDIRRVQQEDKDSGTISRNWQHIDSIENHETKYPSRE